MQNNACRVVSDGGNILQPGSFVYTDSWGLGELLEYFSTALLSLYRGISFAERFLGFPYLREPAEDGFECKMLPRSTMLNFADG